MKNSFFKKQTDDKKIFAVASGTAIPITDVNDEVFSNKVLGDGIAIRVPGEKTEKIVSPVKGKISFVADTFHAIGITAWDGTSIIIHIGIDTVELGGEGFACMVKEGKNVTVGTPLCEVDFPFLLKNNCETDVIVVFADGGDTTIFHFNYGEVVAGETSVMEYEN